MLDKHLMLQITTGLSITGVLLNIALVSFLNKFQYQESYLFLFIKNVSSSTSHKKNLVFISVLRKINKILSSTFFYEHILIQISMNVNTMKAKIYHKLKYDLEGHIML